jgi:phosphatidylglycerophosphate synthase
MTINEVRAADPNQAPRQAPRHTGTETIRNLPNAVTIVRTVGAVAIGAYAVSSHSLLLLGIAYAVYWLGDMADGWVARRLDQETRIGAVLDIVSDRACTALLCVGLLAHLPVIWPVAVLFLLSFMVLDTMLSLAFLYWPLSSPNYFHLVDRRVWQLNWSPVAKAANTAGVVVAVALGAYVVAFVVAAAVVAVKLWTARRISELLREQA